MRVAAREAGKSGPPREVLSVQRTGMVTRRLLLACAGLGAPALALGAAAPTETMLVAGPPNGRLYRWASVIGPAIGRGLPSRTPLDCRAVGGIDGVTGANQFEARAEPDGSTALLVPGSAVVSWMTGESRAQFDFARWVPVWAGMCSAVLVGRSALTRGSHLRIAAPGPTGSVLPALLALDLLGIPTSLSRAEDADAAMLAGPGAEAAALAAGRSGMRPLMTFGLLGADGSSTRDASFPAVPTALELVGGGAPADMTGALRAAALAVQMDACIMLPALTPAASVSLWRHASIALQQDELFQEQASQLSARCVYADVVAAYTGNVAGSRASLLALREWLATRYDWRPT